MISRVLNVYDMERAVGEWNWRSVPDEGNVQENMYQVALKYRTYEPADRVWKDDLVTVEMASAIKKFDRTLKISVGRGMFDSAFEKELLDKCVGASDLYESGQGEVRYTVKDITRLIVPAVTDEMALAEQIEGVTTAQELYDHYRRQSLMEKLQDESFPFTDDYIGRCRFQIENSDLDEMCETEMERCRKISASLGMVFDEMSREQLLGAVGCENIPQFKSMIREYFQKTLRIGLVNSFLEGYDGERLTCRNIPENCIQFRSKVTDIALKKVL